MLQGYQKESHRAACKLNQSAKYLIKQYRSFAPPKNITLVLIPVVYTGLCCSRRRIFSLGAPVSTFFLFSLTRCSCNFNAFKYSISPRRNIFIKLLDILQSHITWVLDTTGRLLLVFHKVAHARHVRVLHHGQLPGSVPDQLLNPQRVHPWNIGVSSEDI